MRGTVRLVLVLGALALLAGCSKLSGTLKPNLPPETTLFVQGPVDTVNHIVHLYWLGRDSDGRVTGYEIRLLNPEAPADSVWQPTTVTDSVFTVYTPDGHTAPIFEVRAIDDEGLKDPVPARQLFDFSNQAPIVTLISKPSFTDKSDTTFASVTVTWRVQDIDGDPARVLYHVWLDGQRDDPLSTTATTFTMPSERFQVNGQYVSGYRWLYVQAIDDGGMAGSIDSVRWYVRRPVSGARARLLIIDDVPRVSTSNFTIDTLYSNTAARNLAPGDWSVLQIDFNQPFKSALDVEQTFKLFDVVLWYRGGEVSLSPVLPLAEPGIGAYLEAGGRFYLDGLYLFQGLNADGGLTEDFADRYLNSDGFRKTFVSVTAFIDSTIGWGNANGSVFQSAMFADSIRQQQLPVITGRAGGFRAFHVRSASDIALIAPPGALSPANSEPMAIGVSVAQPGGGRAVVFCVSLGTSIPRNASNSARMLGKVFGQLGLTGP